MDLSRSVTLKHFFLVWVKNKVRGDVKNTWMTIVDVIDIRIDCNAERASHWRMFVLICLPKYFHRNANPIWYGWTQESLEKSFRLCTNLYRNCTWNHPKPRCFSCGPHRYLRVMCKIVVVFWFTALRTTLLYIKLKSVGKPNIQKAPYLSFTSIRSHHWCRFSTGLMVWTLTFQQRDMTLPLGSLTDWFAPSVKKMWLDEECSIIVNEQVQCLHSGLSKIADYHWGWPLDNP